MSLNSRLLDPPPYGSSEWLLWRRGRLGASDLASIAGLNPWRGEYSLALQKRGLTDGEPESAAMRWGHRIEGLALDAYSEMTGRSPIVRGETWTDARWPHQICTLDGRWERIGVEVKATTRWSDPPPHVRVQVLAQMGIADLEAVDVVRVSPYGEPLITTIERDEQAITDLLELAEAWWARYMTGDEMPPPDGSAESMRHLDTFRGDEAAEATEEQANLMRALRIVRRQTSDLEAEDKRIVGALKASMAGIGSLTGPGFRVTWSAVKPRTSVDWRAVAEELRPDPAVVEKHTTVKEGTTSFRPSWSDDDE